MQIVKTYKFKLQLTGAQSVRVNAWIGTCRYLYNVGKQIKEAHYQKDKTSISAYDLCKQLTDVRKEIQWVRDLPAQSCQDVFTRLENAYQRFFDGLKEGRKAGYPKWAKKGKYRSIAFKIPPSKNIFQTHNRIVLPKLGSVRYFNSRTVEGVVKRVTITQEADGYYASIHAHQEINPIISTNEKQVGIDLGIKYFLVTSDGEYIDNPRFLKTTLPALRRAQRSLSRKVLRSANWYKQLDKVKRLHQKVARQRKDFLNKLSTRLVQSYDTIVVENLNIAGMVKSKLAQSISDVAWGEFLRQLEYKCKWYGKTFLRVNPIYTSQECNACGHTAKENRLTQSHFKCVACGHEGNADELASQTILGRGTSYLFANASH